MTEKDFLANLPIIEVPTELRGLSDDEILVLSESKEKKHPNRAYRLSKKDRILRRQEESRRRLLDIDDQIQKEMAGVTSSRSYMANKPMPRIRDFESDLSKEKNEFSEKKSHYASLADLFKSDVRIEREIEKKPEVIVRSSISSSPKPSSGRVLQAKFTFPGAKKIETTIVDAKTLEEKRAAEREKKIRKTATSLLKPVTPEGTPVKRPRGRPKKIRSEENL